MYNERLSYKRRYNNVIQEVLGALARLLAHTGRLVMMRRGLCESPELPVSFVAPTRDASAKMERGRKIFVCFTIKAIMSV